MVTGLQAGDSKCNNTTVLHSKSMPGQIYQEGTSKCKAVTLDSKSYGGLSQTDPLRAMTLVMPPINVPLEGPAVGAYLRLLQLFPSLVFQALGTVPGTASAARLPPLARLRKLPPGFPAPGACPGLPQAGRGPSTSIFSQVSDRGTP